MKRTLALGFLLLTFVAGAAAQEEAPVNPDTPNTIKQLRQEAERDRSQAERKEREARDYRQLADDARRDAQRTNDPTYKALSLKDAERRDAEAKLLEAEAELLRRRAQEKDERADRLQRALDMANRPKPQPSPSGSPGNSTGVAIGSTSPTPQTRPITAADLVGVWDATGYMCDQPIPVEVIKITAIGNKLTAVKVTGDPCVPAGEITWEGDISGGVITGRWRGTFGPGQPINWVDGVSLRVVDRNTLEGSVGGSTTIRRQKKSNQDTSASRWKLIETIQLPIDGTSITSRTILKQNGNFRIRVSGMAVIGGSGDLLTDAEYGVSRANTNPLNHCYDAQGGTDLGVAIGGVDITSKTKAPNWGSYNKDHVYLTNLIGAGTPIILSYHDCDHSDNRGFLTVEIFSEEFLSSHSFARRSMKTSA